MFDKQYRFKGRHAYRVLQLTNAFDSLSKAQLFNRNIDVYMNAPLIGFLYGRRADKDNAKNPQTNEVYDNSIMGDRVMLSGDELRFNFWLIMLLDSDYEPDESKRIDKAFRDLGKNKDDEERFESYVRGGVDVLYEKLVDEDSPLDSEYITHRLYDFLNDFDKKFNKAVNRSEVLKLCTVGSK